MENLADNLTEYQTNQLRDLLDQASTILSSDFPKISNLDFYLNKDNLIRFAIAYNWDSHEILTKWKDWVQWHTTYQPDKISEEEIIKEMSQAGFLRWYKSDKAKRPCLYFRVKNYRPDIGSIEDVIRYFVFMIEQGLKEADLYGTNKIVVVYDRRGYSKKNQDSNFFDNFKRIVTLLQNYYPERLHGLYFLGSKLFAQVVGEKSKGLISDRTREKIRILGDTQDLLEFFYKEDLTIEYGGISECKKIGHHLERELLSQHCGDDIVDSEDEEDDYEHLEDIMMSHVDNSKFQTESQKA